MSARSSSPSGGPHRPRAAGRIRAGAAALLAASALAAAIPARPAAAQALYTRRLANGSRLVLVTGPEATVTCAAWPVRGEGGAVRVASLIRSDLTLIADLEAALAGDGPAPPVVVAVGDASASDLTGLLERVLAGRTPARIPPGPPPVAEEGGTERRLAPPGSPALLRLSIPLPPEADPLHDSAEVLGEMIPGLVGRRFRGLRVRRRGGVLTLELDIDAQSAGQTVDRLRLALARLAGAPRLDADAVAAVRARLKVQRLARLDVQPDGAEHLVRVWLRGGLAGVRRELFGLAGVTAKTVRRAAAAWLGRHPGAAVLLLPPSALNPRFARPPFEERLDNDLTAVILERPAAALSALCLRPIAIPGLDRESAALVLARLAARIRTSGEAPGWIRVTRDPPALELAAAPDGFPELCEALGSALGALLGGAETVRPAEGGPVQRALGLMAALLGQGGRPAARPADLLRPDNLALGAVAPDRGTAAEALAKFLAGLGGPASSLNVQDLTAVPRTRVPLPGDRSAMAVALPLPADAGEIASGLAAALLEKRALALLPKTTVSVESPFVPGHPVLVLVAVARAPLNTLEQRLQKAWKKLAAPPAEADLGPVRRTLMARLAAEANGALGAARVCARIAVTGAPWRSGGDVERAVMASGAEDLAPLFAAWADFGALQTTGAGPFPVEELPRPAR